MAAVNPDRPTSSQPVPFRGVSVAAANTDGPCLRGGAKAKGARVRVRTRAQGSADATARMRMLGWNRRPLFSAAAKPG